MSYRVVAATVVAALALALGTGGQTSAATISFGKSTLSGATSSNVTSIQFGPDGRLYVAEQFGTIKAYDVVRNGPDDYEVTATETLDHVKSIPNHNDDGAVNSSVTDRQVTGILVTGTAANPVIYATSSDPRIGGGGGSTDTNLDTNSGVLSRLTWDGSQWQKVDLVRGLPRSEENHAPNGMQLEAATNTLYIAQGGHTNMGAPSNNFVFLPEYALSAAILSVDLDAIGGTTYDLPTLDDDSRAGDPDAGDPFGGNNGKNQAILTAGGPVQVHSPGFRNPYDVVLTESGRLYTVDNGPNSGWGDVPIDEGPAGDCTNGTNEPGVTHGDGLHFVSGSGYYGGHPNPTRGNTANTFNGDAQSPVPAANAVECDYRAPGAANGALTVFPASTNGIAEYTATNFEGDMAGDLLMASFDNTIYRVKLDAAGSSAVLTEALFSNVDSIPLDVIAQGDGEPFPGTIWAGDINTGEITVFEPNDFAVCTGADDAGLDEDSDGYDNADEIDNGTNPCSAADVPPDRDGDFTSDLNDPDDDNDGLPDTSDPFAIDPDNGTTTSIPAIYTWENDAPDAGGLLNLGFTGLMTDGASDYEALFDPAQMTAGGAAGVATVDAVPEGDALGATNTQQYGFQFGVDADAGTGVFTAHTRVLAPFNGLTPQDDQSMGLFVGNGDQDNYAKVVTFANGGVGGVQSFKEVAGTVSGLAEATEAMPGPDYVDLFLTVDPAAATVQPSYQVTTGGVPGARTNLGSAQSVPAGWFDGSTGLAIGIISTSAGPGPPFPATWELIQAFPGTEPPEASSYFQAQSFSTYGGDSLLLDNTSTGLNVTNLTVDFSTAVMRDVVWDPDDGTPAGDPVNKDLTIDSESGDGAGVVSTATGDVFGDPFQDGYRTLSIDFTDFEPGESVGFSADVDPTAIQGAAQSGPGEVVGSELIGATIAVTYSGGLVQTSQLTKLTGDNAAKATLNDTMAPAPALAWSGGSTPAFAMTTPQEITISGTPNGDYTVTVVEGVMDLAGVSGGGFDLDPFETDRFVQGASMGTSGEPDTWTEYTGTLDGTGQATVNVALTDSEADLDGSIQNSGVNHIVAFLENAAGEDGRQSNEIRLDYDPDAAPDTDPPDPPTNLAGSGGSTAIALSWTASISGDTVGYNVYRSTTSPVGTSGTPLNGGTLVSGTVYSDTTAAEGVTYFYVATAVDGSGNESVPSNEDSAATTGSITPESALLEFGGGEGGLLDTGFTGVLPNTAGDQYLPANVDLDTGAGTLAITSTDGDMYTAFNDQKNALMLDLDTTQPFGVEARLLPPFEHSDSWDSAGIWAGVNQDNYAKIVVGYNGAPEQVEVLSEQGGAADKAQLDIGTPWSGIATLDLRLTVDPAAGQVTAYMRINSSSPGDWSLVASKPYGGPLQSPSGQAGLMTTNFANATPVTQSFDYFTHYTDSDVDGAGDHLDNCPQTANASQANGDGDAWGDACDACPGTATVWATPAGDDDCDGFSTSAETFMGTAPLAACAVTDDDHDEDPDSWPPDADDDQDVDIGDLIVLFGDGKMFIDSEDPLYSARSDMDGDGDLDVGDVLAAFSDKILTSCG